MKTSTIVWVVVVVLVVLGGWYWLSSQSAAPASVPSTALGLNGSPNQTNTGQATVPPVVTVANNATLGNYLVAQNGMTLYRFTRDTAGVSNCSGTCATIWPPYIYSATEPMIAGQGATGQLATITRADGTLQVTYNGMPLYYYSKDVKVGDTTGQNVGGIWFVVTP